MDTNKILSLQLVCILTLTSLGFSQPAWVKNAIQEANNIKVHSDADAVVLHDVAVIEISNKATAKTSSQIAYKILTEDGERFGTTRIPISSFLKIKTLKGWVIKDDGSSKSLSKKNIITVSPKEIAGYYDDSQLVIATLPEVEPGVIVAFERTTEEQGWTSLYQSFVFQIQQPVRFTQFSIIIPEKWQLIKAGWNVDNVQFEQQNNRYIWTAADLPYQPEEPLAPSWYYLSQRISVSCFNPERAEPDHFADWTSVADRVISIFHQPSKPNSGVIVESNRITEGLTTFEEKIETIATFLQDEIRDVLVEIGKGRWHPRIAAATLFNRYGDCKDKTTLMCAMLKAVGIKSVPVLANVHYPVDPRLPTPFQFNHCIIGIPIQNEPLSLQMQHAIVGNWLLFDPTDRSIPIGQLPWSLQGNRVLLATNVDTVLLRLPYPDPKDFRCVYRAKAKLTSDGSISANITITDFGGRAANSRYKHRNTSKKKQIEYWRTNMSQTIPGVELSNHQTKETSDSVWISFAIEGSSYIQKTGDFLLLRPDLFHAPEPPELTADERQHPIWLGHPEEIETNIIWQLPGQWIIEMDSTTVQYTCDSAEIHSTMSLSENMLNFKSVYRQNGKFMLPEQYESARKFSKSLSFVRKQTILMRNN